MTGTLLRGGWPFNDLTVVSLHYPGSNKFPRFLGATPSDLSRKEKEAADVEPDR